MEPDDSRSRHSSDSILFKLKSEMEINNRFPVGRAPRFVAVAALLAAVALNSCSTIDYPATGRTDRYVNPNPAGGRPHITGHRRTTNRPASRTSNDRGPMIFFDWLFGDYQIRESRRVRKQAPERPAIPPTKTDEHLLARSNANNTRLVIDIAKQRAFLLVDEQIAMESPISTARPGKHTPRGTFRVSERIRSGKISTIYGVAMPYWMRLSGSVYGVHAGYLPGYPASAGCVRMPTDAAEIVFNHTRNGTRVSIHSSWAADSGKT